MDERRSSLLSTPATPVRHRLGPSMAGLLLIAFSLTVQDSTAGAQPDAGDATPDVGNVDAEAGEPHEVTGEVQPTDAVPDEVLTGREEATGDAGPELERPPATLAAETAEDEAAALEPAVLRQAETPAEQSLRQLGARLRRAEDQGRRLATGTLARARSFARPFGDPRLTHLMGNAPTAEAAEVLGVVVSELSLMDAVEARLADFQRERQRLETAIADARAVARRFHWQANRTLPEANCQDDVCIARRVVVGLLRRAARQADRDATAAEWRVEIVEAAAAYLERRREALEEAAVVEPIGSSSLSEEISRDQQRLDRETQVTQEVEVAARAVERRAEEERLRAQEARDAEGEALADELSRVASELSRVAEARRLEEARLSDLTARREAFLAQQAAVRSRLTAIRKAPEDDATVPERADRLYDELFQQRYEARNQVAAIRFNLGLQRQRIEQLEADVGRARGRLDLARTTPERGRDFELQANLVELRQADVELAERRHALEVMRHEFQRSYWQLIERQVYFTALSTDDLIDYLSDARRDKVFEFTGRNLYEAQQNARDRVIGFSLVVEDRLARIDDLSRWLSSLDGVLWLSKILVVLFVLVVAYRMLRRRRDRHLGRLLQRLDRYAWVERHFRLVLKVAELVRESLGPAVTALAVMVVFNRLQLELPEARLLRDTLLKLIVLFLLLRWVQVLILRRSQRAEKGEELAPFGIDVFNMSTRTARLVALTFRIWLFYVVLASILLDFVQFVFGRGFSPNLLDTLADWGQLGLVYVLCWLWRQEIVDVFLQLTQSEDGRVARFLRKHRDRIYSVLFLAVLAIYNLGRLSYQLARQRLLPRAIVRRVEAFVFRKRVEMAKGTGETAPISTASELPPGYVDLLGPLDMDSHHELAVVREKEQAVVAQAIHDWQERGHASSVAVYGEDGSGRTTFLQQVQRNLPEHVDSIYFRIDRRITDSGEMLVQLSQILDVPGAGDQESLIEAVSDRPPRIVLLDDCHNLFLRTVRGLEGLELFLNVLSLTSRQILWVTAFNRYSWEFINRVHDRRHYFRHVIGLDDMNEQQIQELVERRNRAAEVSPNFGSLLTSGRRSGAGPAVYEVVKTSAGYYRLLAEFARGNPRVALLYWRQSLQARKDGSIDVVLFRRPDEEPLKQLGERQLFALTAIAQHERLTAEEMARVVGVEKGLCELDVHFLTESELVSIDSHGCARLTTAYMRQVLTRLQASNLLYLST